MPHLIRKLSGADETAFLDHMKAAQTPAKIRAIRTAIRRLDMALGGKTTLPRKAELVEGLIVRMEPKPSELSGVKVTTVEVLREMRWLRDHPAERSKYGS